MTIFYKKDKNESYNFSSPKYENLFRQNYLSFCKNIKQRLDNYYLEKKYCLFYPCCGSNDDKKIKFIFYGQAVNGWDGEKCNLHFKVTDIENSIAQNAKEYSNPIEVTETNLEWVENKWTTWSMYRSFFWNVCYKLINRSNCVPDNNSDWHRHLIWSNLMKVAPAEGGNPDDIEWQAQLEKSVVLFQQELEEVQPEYAVLLTNWEWAKDFVKNKNFLIKKNEESEFIQAYGNFGKTKIIVSKRPYPNGSSERCVNEILSLIKT